MGIDQAALIQNLKKLNSQIREIERLGFPEIWQDKLEWLENKRDETETMLKNMKF